MALKVLYFDIDGTVLLDGCDRAKPALAGGRLEAAVREAGVQRLVCVGSFVTVARLMMQVDENYDALGMILELCQGAFADSAWFRASTDLVQDADDRARCVDMSDDWW